MIGIEFEKSIVALASWSVGRQDLYKGMAGVAMVIRNRAIAGWFEGSLYLNAVAVLNENPITEYPDAREPEFQKILQAMDGIFEGSIPDKTDGGLWITNIRTSVEQIKGTVTCTIGQLMFVK